MSLSAKDLKDLEENETWNERGNKMGVRLIIMKKIKWTLIEFTELHGERHAQRQRAFFPEKSGGSKI
jgi:hypothetical protein